MNDAVPDTNVRANPVKECKSWINKKQHFKEKAYQKGPRMSKRALLAL